MLRMFGGTELPPPSEPDSFANAMGMDDDRVGRTGVAREGHARSTRGHFPKGDSGGLLVPNVNEKLANCTEPQHRFRTTKPM